MTNEEWRQIASAIERADVKNVRVIATRMRRDTGELVWLVNSASHPGRLHIVHQVDDHHLACTCVAGQHEKVCMHRAKVHQALCDMQAREAARKRAQATVAGILYRSSDKPVSVFV